MTVGRGVAVGGCVTVNLGGVSGLPACWEQRVQVEAGHLADHGAVRHAGRHPVDGRCTGLALLGVLKKKIIQNKEVRNGAK